MKTLTARRMSEVDEGMSPKERTWPETTTLYMSGCLPPNPEELNRMLARVAELRKELQSV